MTLIIILFTLGNIPSAIFAIITSVELRSKNWFEVEKKLFAKIKHQSEVFLHDMIFDYDLLYFSEV